MCTIYVFFVALNCCVISFFGDLRYFVENFLSQFMRFCVEKIKPKIVSVEKKGQISCMSLMWENRKNNKGYSADGCWMAEFRNNFRDT